jgi:hypothetical protein
MELLYLYLLLFLPGQTGKACESSKKQCSFGNRGGFDRKVLSLSPLKVYFLFQIANNNHFVKRR